MPAEISYRILCLNRERIDRLEMALRVVSNVPELRIIRDRYLAIYYSANQTKESIPKLNATGEVA